MCRQALISCQYQIQQITLILIRVVTRRQVDRQADGWIGRCVAIMQSIGAFLQPPLQKSQKIYILQNIHRVEKDSPLFT